MGERSIPAVRLKHIAAHALAVVLGLLILPAPALAGRVLLLSPDGHERAVDEAGVSGTDLPPAPGGARAARAARARTAVRAGATRTALRSLLSSGQIDQVEYNDRLRVYNAAVSMRNSLSGKRRKELGWVIENTDEMAQRGALTAARLEPIFLIVAKNTEFWTKYSIPSAGDRV